MLQEKAITKTKDIIIKYLKGFLLNVDNYNDICSYDFTDCRVFDKEPNELRYFPTILITSASGNFITTGLGDVAQDIYDNYGDIIGYRYAGILELPITVEMATKTTRERDVLSDLIASAIRLLLRRHLEAAGILIKDMRYVSENEITYDSDKIYISTIQFTCWTEWQKDVNVASPFTNIDVEVEVNKHKNKNKSGGKRI